MAGPFAAVVPSTTDLEAKLIEWIFAQTAADNGTVADTQLKNDKRAELEAMLTLQAENCAEIANGDLALYLRTGYEAKDTQGQPTGVLPKVTGLELDYGDNDGELKASWDAVEDAQNFTVQVYVNPLNPLISLIKEHIKPKIGKKKTILNELPSGRVVFVRVRANGGSTGHGPWSDVAEKRVP
jgi:hypothetical protein